MPKEILEMPIEAATMELPDTKTIRLKWPDGHNPDLKPAIHHGLLAGHDELQACLLSFFLCDGSWLLRSHGQA